MKKTDELKELLDRFKEGDSYPEYSSGTGFRSADYKSGLARAERKDLAWKSEDSRYGKGYNPKFNVIWSENKETLLFGILASIIAAALGLIGKENFLVLAGAVSFVLFSFLSFMAFFRYILIASNQEKIPEDVREKLGMIEKKLETISREGGHDYPAPSEERLAEIDQKLEELKVVVKTIAQKRN